MPSTDSLLLIPIARTLLLLVLVGSALPAQADEPWRLNDQEWSPDWLTLSGSYRLRYEWLDNAFNANVRGSDDLLVSRIMLGAEAQATDSLRLGVEFVDARAWGSDADTPLGTDDVNAAEVLQIYAGYESQSVFVDDDLLDLRVGRFTLGMGSNRLVARHVYRQTLQGFSGVSANWSRSEGVRLQLFATRPVTRAPSDRSGLADNDIEWDELADTDFWGIHLDRWVIGNINASVYLFGIDDSYRGFGTATLRNHLTAGFRVLESRGLWRWELEAAYQNGEVRSIGTAATQTLDHSAAMIHARIGRRLEHTWNPELQLRFDYASGDDQPNDSDSGRYDTLFGPLRFDFGPTGLYNAIRRVNVNTVGLYMNLEPRTDTTLMVGYRSAWLDSRRDAFGGSGLRDAAGESGRFVGHQLEARYRWEFAPGNWRFEAGGAYLWKGEFLSDAPGSLDPGNTLYLYSNVLLSF